MLAKLTRAHEYLARLRRGVALRRKKSVSQRDLQRQLLLLARRTIRHPWEEIEAFPELRGCLDQCPPCNRLLARFEPVANRLLY